MPDFLFMFFQQLNMYKKTPYMMSACPLETSGHGVS